VGFDDDFFPLGLTDAVSQEADEFFERFQLFLGGFVMVVIADEADADSDVVEVVTMNVASG